MGVFIALKADNNTGRIKDIQMGAVYILAAFGLICLFGALVSISAVPAVTQ
jgi:hypothetical protein